MLLFLCFLSHKIMKPKCRGPRESAVPRAPHYLNQDLGVRIPVRMRLRVRIPICERMHVRVRISVLVLAFIRSMSF